MAVGTRGPRHGGSEHSFSGYICENKVRTVERVLTGPDHSVQFGEWRWGLSALVEVVEMVRLGEPGETCWLGPEALVGEGGGEGSANGVSQMSIHSVPSPRIRPEMTTPLEL